MKHIFLIAGSCLAVFVITIFFRLGGHKRVHLETKEIPKAAALFTEHLGPYHQVNSSIVKVETWAMKNNIPCQKTFGVYLDDPNTSDETRLRSEVGCLLEGIEAISIASELPEWLQTKAYPAGKYVIATFTGAPSIGPFKVYPAVDEYIQKERLTKIAPPMEIYSFTGEREALTTYRFQVE